MVETCHCGKTYEAFRCTVSFAEAYQQVAYSDHRTHVSRATVLRQLARVKRQEWAYHQETCDTWPADATAFDFGANAPA